MVLAKLNGFLILPMIVLPGWAHQSPTPEPAATLRVESNLVVVDVVVTDSHQNPVHGLTAAEFSLREDGRPQSIKVFEEHAAEQGLKTAQPLPRHEPGIYTNDLGISATGPLNLILLDHLNTSQPDQKKALDQVQLYLRDAPPGERFAILTLTSTQLYLLQGFTADHGLLMAALASKQAGPSYPVYLTAPTSSSPTGPAGANPATASKTEFRRQLTLDSLNQLGRYLGQIPGRKNVLWFSSSFPISILSDGDVPEETRPGYVEEFREMVNLFAHNQVAVYPIDTRGLTTEPMFTSANANTGGGGRANAVIPSQSETYYSGNAARLGAMQDIADATGGQTFVNTNSLKQAASRAVEGGSNYYTIAYTPGDGKWNGKYRKIQVELARKGFTLAYRRGYYANAPNAPLAANETKGDAETKSGQPAPYSAMHTAMVHGGPEPTEILFEAIVRPSVAEQEAGVYPHNQPSTLAKGPYRRYNVHYKAHLDDIHCTPTPQGPLYCAVEFVTSAYDSDGNLINTQVNDIKEMVKPDYFASLHRAGLHPEFQYKQEISVPVKGEYYLRVGVHDLLTNRVGALELPVSGVSNLAPVAATSAAALPAAK